jgi:hypothetical protein
MSFYMYIPWSLAPRLENINAIFIRNQFSVLRFLGHLNGNGCVIINGNGCGINYKEACAKRTRITFRALVRDIIELSRETVSLALSCR